MKLRTHPSVSDDFHAYVPAELQQLNDPQTTIPAIAKDQRLLGLISDAVQEIPTHHRLVVGNPREMPLAENSVHLVVTSPPYWTLKAYRDTEGQLVLQR